MKCINCKCEFLNEYAIKFDTHFGPMCVDCTRIYLTSLEDFTSEYTIKGVIKSGLKRNLRKLNRRLRTKYNFTLGLPKWLW